MMTQEELIAWRAEVDANRAAKMEELVQRIRTESPWDIGLQIGRLGLSSEIASLEAVMVCLGEIIRGARL